MPRVARTVIPNCPHHITQRGNNRQDVFFVDDDRRQYLEFLQQRCEIDGVEVLGYCLMANHVHLVAVPRSEDGLARAVGRTHFLYTQYVNRMHGRSGHLWQNRFYSCTPDEPHLWTALRYVERNPVRARLFRRPWRWPWSSAAAHVAERPDASGLLDLETWFSECSPERWRQELAESVDDAAVGRLHRCTHSGRPLASDNWISKLEQKLGRRLRALPVGRPRKQPQGEHKRSKEKGTER